MWVLKISPGVDSTIAMRLTVLSSKRLPSSGINSKPALLLALKMSGLIFLGGPSGITLWAEVMLREP